MRLGRLTLAAAALLTLTTASVPTGTPLSQTERHALSSDAFQPRGAAPRPVVQRPKHEAPFGAFVGSWDKYIPQLGRYAQWLNNANMQVGHTYLVEATAGRTSRASRWCSACGRSGGWPTPPGC